jgi:hypothetical protein
MDNKLILKNSWFYYLNNPCVSRFNFLFMMANQILIMVRINFYYFFNFLAFKIHYKKGMQEKFST